MNKDEAIKKDNFLFRTENQDLNVEVLDENKYNRNKEKEQERYDAAEIMCKGREYKNYSARGIDEN